MGNKDTFNAASTMQARPSQVVDLLTLARLAKRPALLVGPPGVGKTDMFKQQAERAGALWIQGRINPNEAERAHTPYVISHPPVQDVTHYSGIPFPSLDGKRAEWLPFGELARFIDTEYPIDVLFDDLGQAPDAVQKALMQMFLERSVNGNRISDNVWMCAATNRREDRAGVSGIINPLINRTMIIQVDVDKNDWLNWADDNAIEPHIQAFMHYQPQYLLQMPVGGDIQNFPTPRAWHHASDLLYAAKQHYGAAGMDPAIQRMALMGIVGPAAGAACADFIQLYSRCPDLNAILMDPNNPKLWPDDKDPEYVGILFATAIGLSGMSNVNTIGPIMKYAERYEKQGKGEIGMFLLNQAARKDWNVLTTLEWRNTLQKSKLGQVIQGIMPK